MNGQRTQTNAKTCKRIYLKKGGLNDQIKKYIKYKKFLNNKKKKKLKK